MGQISLENQTKNDSLIVDTIYDHNVKQWLLRTNDIGAKAIRFIYESRNLERENNILLKEELSLCDSEITVLQRDIFIYKDLVKNKDSRINYIEQSENLYINETKRLKKQLIFSNVREVLLGLLGTAAIGYGIYITIDK